MGDDRVEGRVHRAGEVARVLLRGPVELDRALVVERPGWVGPARPAGRGVVVPAVAQFVAQGPRDHRGMVLVALDHPGDAGDPLVEVARVVAQRPPERVRLDVGLVHDVQPELVGEVEERGVVRVVRGPDRVEPELLHRHEVGPHVRHGHDPARPRVEVVAVDAADEDPPAVDQEVAPGDLDAPEADPDAGGVDGLARGRAERDNDLLERRLLGRPRPDARDREPVLDPADRRRVEPAMEGRPVDVALGRRARGVGGGAGEEVGLRLGEPALGLWGGRGRDGVAPLEPGAGHLDRPAGPRIAACRADVHPQVDRPGHEVLGEPADRPDVGEMGRPGRVQDHGPADAAVPPLVLVLDVGRVGPLHDAQRQAVGARPGHLGQVELGGEMGVLAEPDLDAVQGDDQDALGRADVEDDPPAGPCRGDLEVPLVDAGRIVRGDLRRVPGKRHLDVRVVGLVGEALHRPHARDIRLGPVGSRLCVGCAEQLEPPPPVELDPPGGVVVAEGVHRQAVDGGELGLEPRPETATDRHAGSRSRARPALGRCAARAHDDRTVDAA